MTGQPATAPASRLPSFWPGRPWPAQSHGSSPTPTTRGNAVASIDWQHFVDTMLAETNGKLQRVAIVTQQGTVLGRTESIEPAAEDILPLLGIFEESARLPRAHLEDELTVIA
ncbi:MAG: hypothetical protein JWN52_3265 [Actinomycetia bacterium]|nr:hypothetical protein [Actinomycetes bacterium]